MRKCESDAKMRKIFASHRITKRWRRNGKIDRSIALSQSHSHRTTSPAIVYAIKSLLILGCFNLKRSTLLPFQSSLFAGLEPEMSALSGDVVMRSARKSVKAFRPPDSYTRKPLSEMGTPTASPLQPADRNSDVASRSIGGRPSVGVENVGTPIGVIRRCVYESCFFSKIANILSLIRKKNLSVLYVCISL